MAKVKEVGEIYRCEICGNVVEVKEVGGGELVCCGQPMKLLTLPRLKAEDSQATHEPLLHVNV